MESIILTIVGLSLLIWRNRIADELLNRNMRAYKVVFGSRIESYEPWLRKLNRWGIVFGGIVLLLMAYAIFFGPIHT